MRMCVECFCENAWIVCSWNMCVLFWWKCTCSLLMRMCHVYLSYLSNSALHTHQRALHIHRRCCVCVVCLWKCMCTLLMRIYVCSCEFVRSFFHKCRILPYMCIYIYTYVHMYIESFPRMYIQISSHDLRMSCKFSKKMHVRKTKEVKHVYRHSI